MNRRACAVVFLLLLVPSLATAETLFLTSGTFSVSRSQIYHGVSFSVSGERGSLSGFLLDDGWGGSFGCNFSGIGSTSCVGGAGLNWDGVSYPYAAVSVSPLEGPYLIGTPGGGESTMEVTGMFSVFMSACQTPGNNCIQLSASGPAIATVHYVEGFPGDYREDWVHGTIVPEPTSFMLLGSGALTVLGALRKKLTRSGYWFRA